MSLTLLYYSLSPQVDKVGGFTAAVVDALRERLFKLQSQVRLAPTPQEKEGLLEVSLIATYIYLA